MTKPPAFQLYAKDALEGTVDLSVAEFGLYWRLLFWSWGKGPLPNDPIRLARMAGCTERELAALWPAVREKFSLTAEGLVNPRLEKERDKQAAYREQQAANAQRRLSRGSAVVLSVVPTVAQPSIQPDTQQNKSDGTSLHLRSSSSSPISDLQLSSPTADQEPRAHLARAPKESPHEASFAKQFWPAYPRKVAKPKALKAWRKLAPDLDTISAIVTALDWQCRQPRWLEDRGEYIPHAATWLNDRRWEDEQPSARRPQMGSAEYYDHATDWVLECKRLHEGKCGSPSAHHTRVILDADKAERAGGAAVTP